MWISLLCVLTIIVGVAITFDQDVYTVDEDDGIVQLCVNLTDVDLETEVEVAVSFETGSATDGGTNDISSLQLFKTER